MTTTGGMMTKATAARTATLKYARFERRKSYEMLNKIVNPSFTDGYEDENLFG